MAELFENNNLTMKQYNNLRSPYFYYFMEENKQQENLISRPPVVVVLGHVDHGKSSLLEAIKDFKILEKESGGITQHIGAYEIEQGGKKITFIDTPGHEAFSAMRSRGAKVADIAVLVIAAEDGVKPQTKEAISHIKKTGIPMIVAINKIDKPEANPERVKRELAQQDVLVESMGGKIPSVETSAVNKKGIDTLLDLIILIGEMEELKGDITKPGEGVIIEAYLDAQRGPTATLLLRDGILKQGDIIATSSTLGKIKILEDFQGNLIDRALPSDPVIVLGFEKVPEIGEKFRIFSSTESAQKYILKKERKKKGGKALLIESGKPVINLILKADVLGSLEAIEKIIKNLPQEKITLRILKSEVGEISETDVKLARSAKAKILGFRVKINHIAQNLAERENLKIMTFDVIYEIVQKVREIMEKSIKPEKIRIDLGKMKALIIFRTEKNRQIVGGKIIEGEIKKGTLVEVLRDNQKIGRGRVINLQKNKKDIKKAVKGDEVGILFEGDAKIEEKDILAIYSEQMQKEKL